MFNALEDDELDSNWPSSVLFVCAVLRHFRAENPHIGTSKSHRSLAVSKTPPVSGILHTLDPVQLQPQHAMGHVRNQRPSENGHAREKEKSKGGGFGGRDGEKDKDRDRDRDRNSSGRLGNEIEIGAGSAETKRTSSLARSVRFLTATASEDWTLVLDVCDHANESNAKEAVHVLRLEFKYGEPAAQLAAVRIWVLMLRNSSDTFISQSTSRKFLDTLEDLLISSRTSPVVREHVMDVVAAATYASETKKDTGFRGLWRRVKPWDKPEEGMPFDAADATANAPIVTCYDATPTTSDNPEGGKKSDKPHREYRHRIIPPNEDMRRLFQECKSGSGMQRSSARRSRWRRLRISGVPSSPCMVEFHKKCMDSQELIFMQIPWASAGAECSRVALTRRMVTRSRIGSAPERATNANHGRRDAARGRGGGRWRQELVALTVAVAHSRARSW
ncbi:hypothetical protein B0H17DRAFT_1217794 [Mycena rosella]|uniref:VHS domain-containing protein n=1 Tax=Mycena rosella TaxID=1033263 RepID=A0AAD7FPV1_MYCRO|nr:hypothetical protein B0H17DRAFT_1217794 [Mycena rosella]